MSERKRGMWVLNGEKLPRSTKFYRRKRLEQENKLQAVTMQQSIETPASKIDHSIVESEILAVCDSESNLADEDSSVSFESLHSTSLSDESDDDISVPTTKVIRRKQKKRTPELMSMSDSSDSPGSIVDEQFSSSDELNEYRANNVTVVEKNNEGQNNGFQSAGLSEYIQKLCPCTDKTVGDIVFMILSLGIRHSMSWDAQIDTLKLISSIFKNKDIPTSKYLYFKYFDVEKLPITYQVFCPVCDRYLGKKDDVKDIQTCPSCDETVNVNSPSNTFVTLSVAYQLQTYLKDTNFVKNILNHRFKRPSNPSEYHDVYDGAVYKNLSKQGGILSNPLNFSYNFFVDGMTFGPSSDKTVWPIFLTINELPYEERSKYLLLAALYIGKKHPKLHVYLTPFVNEANILSCEGVNWTYENKEVISKFIPLCCVADSVTRCKLMNYQQFCAVFGCTFCYHKSVNFFGKGQRFVIDTVAPLRTEESLKEDLHQVYLRRDRAKDEDRCYRGVKGYSPLSSLLFFSFTLGFVVDYMHCILLGVVKTHMELLLGASRKNFWLLTGRWAKEHLIAAIDKNMEKIKSNTSIIRELRLISSMAQWKASEFRSWLLFHCIPCLTGLFKPQYLSHLAMLSKASHTLLQRSLTYDDIKTAHRLLIIYSSYFQKYFGPENMTYNVHLLSHVTQGVLNYGPIVGHNSFMYEAQNRYLRQMCQSPFSVVLQVARKFLVFKGLPLLCSKIVTSQDSVLFCEGILKYKKLKKCFQPFVECTLLGKSTLCSLSHDETTAIFEYATVRHYHQRYPRMILRGRVYCTTEYGEQYQNDNSCVLTEAGEVVLIHHIIELMSGQIVVLAQKMTVQRKPCVANNYTKINHVKRVEKSGIIICLPVNSIAQPCILMLSATNDLMFSPIPYGCSVE